MNNPLAIILTVFLVLMLFGVYPAYSHHPHLGYGFGGGSLLLIVVLILLLR